MDVGFRWSNHPGWHLLFPSMWIDGYEEGLEKGSVFVHNCFYYSKWSQYVFIGYKKNRALKGIKL